MGVHRFRSRSRGIRRVWSKRSFILHYPSCGFERFLNKYKMLGNFEDRWFEQIAIRNQMSFHAAARDLVFAGDFRGARALYQERVLMCHVGDAARERLLEQGGLRRIREPARLLER